MSNTIYWDPSAEPDILRYELETAALNTGPWSTLASVSHAIPGPNYLAGPPAQFFYEHALGTLSTWYRLRTVDTALQASAWSAPFNIGLTSASLATSDIDVVQMALAEVGQTDPVTSLTAPTTKAEILAARFLPRVRNRLLRKLAPSWATRRARLVLLSDHERPGWTFVYQLPTDSLRPIGIDMGYRASPVAGHLDDTQQYGANPRWAVEANNTATGKVFCCDVPDATLVYTALIADPSLWDQGFLDAVVWGLAAKLAMPLSVKAELAQLATAMAKQSLLDAGADDSNEANPDPQPDSEFITGRSW